VTSNGPRAGSESVASLTSIATCVPVSSRVIAGSDVRCLSMSLFLLPTADRTQAALMASPAPRPFTGGGARRYRCSAARRPPDTGGSDTYDPPQGFPACRACCAVLPPLPVQGRARLWCGAGCRVWAGRHPGLTRAGRGVSERSRAALELWAGDGWEASQQPWCWPGTWQVMAQAQARALLADTGAG